MFIAYELDTWTHNLTANFSLRDCSFGAIKLTENAYPNKYWDKTLSLMNPPQFHFQVENFVKGLFFFGVVSSSSVNDDNRKTEIFVKVQLMG